MTLRPIVFVRAGYVSLRPVTAKDKTLVKKFMISVLDKTF
jgi:hypothetical protein